MKDVIQEQINEYWVKCLNTEEQLKLLSNRLRALDSNKKVNLRAYAGLQKTRDELNLETGDTSQSTCLRVIDSEEDPELWEERRRSRTPRQSIRRTTTQGYDLSANGAGENAVGCLKRKARQLLIGSRLPSSWWGPAILAAAHYSRCAEGLENWPRLGFGTRAMVVLDPEPRDSVAPRSLPTTVFGSSERVSGTYVMYQQGKLKDSVNVQATVLTPQELVYEKTQLQNWECLEAPQKLHPPICGMRVRWTSVHPDEKNINFVEDRLCPEDEDSLEHEEEPLKGGILGTSTHQNGRGVRDLGSRA